LFEGAVRRRFAGLVGLVLAAASACGPATPVVNRAAQVFVATAVAIAPKPAPRRTPEPDPPPGPAVRPDASSVDAIVDGLYAAVSHGPEYEPDYERLRKMFLPGAIIVPPRPPTAAAFGVLDFDGFAERIRRYIAGRQERGEPLGFTEREIGRREDCFGNVCQVFSTYETLRAPGDPAPFTRGVHSIQLVDDGSRWWIAALAWDNERPDNPIPPEGHTP
jgi:hypothetical protein